MFRAFTGLKGLRGLRVQGSGFLISWSPVEGFRVEGLGGLGLHRGPRYFSTSQRAYIPARVEGPGHLALLHPIAVCRGH